jgi:sodium transport system permease protein
MNNPVRIRRPSLINLRRVLTVFKKEMRESLRDYRVLFGVFISPLIVTPLVFVAIGYFQVKKFADEKTETLAVGLVGGAQSPAVRDAVRADATLTVSEITAEAEAKTLVKSQKLRAALVIPADAQAKLDGGDTAKISVLCDLSNEKSRTAQTRLKTALEKFDQKTLADRLQRRGLNDALLKPTDAETVNLASEESTGGFILGLLLPYIIILMVSLGGVTSALDLCAGEKERGTMETLLVSPASRTEIVLGKMLTITSMGWLGAIFSIVGILGTFVGGKGYAADLLRGKLSFSFSYSTIITSVALVIPLAFFSAALLIVISSFARNQKEAQAYVTPFLIISMLIGTLSFVFGAENPLGLSLVPILNCVIAIKQILASTPSVAFIGLTFISSTVYASFATLLCVALFNREEILFRS